MNRSLIPATLAALLLLAGSPAPAAPGGPHGASADHSRAAEKGPRAGKTASERLAAHPALSGRLEKLLPAGTDLQAASAGFRNLGQFVAAVHVSSNLGIPFDQLEGAMVRDKLSLGQAIHRLKPEVDARTEALKAERQARRELGSGD